MMAASVIESGSSLIMDCHNNPDSMQNVSLHDPTVETNPASPVYMDGDPTDDLEEARNSYNNLHRSLSSAGKKIAECSKLGQKADKSFAEFLSETSISNSSYSDESCQAVSENEAKIAFSQLKELEVAIKTRKDTRVDGRKTRWEAYRKGKNQSSKKSDDASNISSNSENEFIQSIDDNKEVFKIKKGSGNKSNYKVKQLKKFVSKANSSSITSDEISQTIDNIVNGIYSNNNNTSVVDNYNHSDNSHDTMKVDESSPVLGAIETNNVLETMKQQFLEGTCNISESTPMTSKEKKKKLKKTGKQNYTNDENIKRKPGRPKKKAKSLISSTPSPEDNIDSSLNIKCEGDVILQNVTDALTPKKENKSMLSMSPDFYLRKNPVTRGLREVRKSESGSDSNSSTPVKDTSLHLKLSPGSPPLALSPNMLTPIKYENTNGTAKLPLFNAVAKSLVDFAEKKSDENDKNNSIKKVSKNDSSLVKNKQDAHKVQTVNGDNQEADYLLSSICSKIKPKRGRGRKKAFRNSWPKKTSMVIAEVHNSMNGESQAVINTTSSVGRKKKKYTKNINHLSDTAIIAIGSPRKSLNKKELVSNKENSIKPVVPSLKSTQNLSKTNFVPAKSAYDNTPINIFSKSTNSDVKSNKLGLEENNHALENDNSSTVKINANVDSEYTMGKLHNSLIEFNPKLTNTKSDPTIIKNTISDKKQKSILAYSTQILTKDKISTNYLAEKSLKSSPIKPDSMKNGNHLSNTSSGNVISNGNVSLDEMPMDQISQFDPLGSPSKKSLLTYSSDKQKKDKVSKNKSLSAVIEKLNKPVHKSSDSSSDDESKNENQSGYKIKKIKTSDENHATIVSDKEEYIELPIVNKAEILEKVKKPPRFLVELFKDEGVQLMLGSMKPNLSEGNDILESGQHKLRPKRINENCLSESPEPEESFQKRKKRHTEVDNLFVDEGTLNLLTSIESNTRRPSFNEDTASEFRKSNNNKIISSLKVTEGKKRKLSGTSNSSGSIPPLNDNKRMKLDSGLAKPTIIGEAVKKKVGRPSNAELLKKKQLMQAIEINGESNTIKIAVEKSQIDSMSVPPLKIKLTNNDEASNKPTNHLSEQVKVSKAVNIIVGKPIVSSPEVGLKTNHHLAQSRTITNTSQARVHGIPIRKLLPPGTPKTMKIGLIKPLDKDRQGQQKIRKPEVLRQSQRASVRNNEVTNHFRDIHLRKYNHFMHIIFNPSTTKMKNAFNSKALRELCEALNYIKKDPTVNVVLFTATGSTFCQGIDITSLQHSNIEIRKKNATNLTRAIKEFLHCLITFPKVIIAGINGNAIGLGVTMLPLFDLVIATDKAEFSLPYGELGQVPEGGATYTFPQNYGKLQSNNLFMGKKLSAVQAQSMGLVSDTLWAATFIQELIPKVASIASHPGPGLEATKSLMNHYMMTKLELSVEAECRTLLQQWSTPSFACQCKRYLESNHMIYQAPAFTNRS